MEPDQFVFEVDRAEWLFTLSLGLGIGLVAAAAVITLWRPRGWPNLAIALAVGGMLLSAFTGTLAVDAAPWSLIDLRLKPYFSSIAFTVAMAGALVVGALVTMSAAVLFAWLARRRNLPNIIAVSGAVAAAIVALAVVLPIVVRAAGGTRHPAGTIASRTIPARVLFSGLEVPTGIDIASNGDILVVELTAHRILVLTPAGSDYRVSVEVPLDLPDWAYAFHGVFHPDYPDEPFAYIVSQQEKGDSRALQVLRVSLDGSAVAEPIITNLPTAPATRSNHHGAGLAICGEFLFVSTSDGDSLVGEPTEGSRRWQERARAQLPASGVGQVMRWRFDGIDLEPSGVFGMEFPSFAMGFRNPYGIGCDVPTGNALVADNGERGHDQVRLVEPGSNHGWPVTHERILIPPWFDGAATRIAPTGIAARVSDPNLLLMSAFQSQALYELTIDRDRGETTAIRLLAEVDGGAYAVAVGSDGCVYFTDVTAVWRLQEPGCE